MTKDISLAAFFIILIALYTFLAQLGNNLIFLVIALELKILALGVLAVVVSVYLDDATGAILTLYLLPIAGSESAIALSLLVSYYTLYSNLSITN